MGASIMLFMEGLVAGAFVMMALLVWSDYSRLGSLSDTDAFECLRIRHGLPDRHDLGRWAQGHWALSWRWIVVLTCGLGICVGGAAIAVLGMAKSTTSAVAGLMLVIIGSSVTATAALLHFQAKHIARRIRDAARPGDEAQAR